MILGCVQSRCRNTKKSEGIKAANIDEHVVLQYICRSSTMKRYTCYQPDVEEVEVEIVQTMVVGERSLDV